MVRSTSSVKVVDGETNLKEVITNGKFEQFDTLLEELPGETRATKKKKYLNEDIKYPKAVWFIISTEFCERFSYYGMRAILSLYLVRVLNYSSSTATMIYHSFLSSAYFFPLAGAIIADSFCGKFRVIFYLSIVYAIGNLTISFAATPYTDDLQRTLSLLGLFLIALGTGGIKPCVSAFGGDQFILPQQEVQLRQFFSWFYFSINAGSLLSMYLTPAIRFGVRCFGEDSCYPLAFGVPAILMWCALAIFVLGKPFYRTRKVNESNQLIAVVKCIFHALGNKIKNRGVQKSHWLYHADDKYDSTLIEDTRSVLHTLLVFVPLPAFWALYDQQGSRWTFQATNMDGSLGWFGFIKPEQIQLANPLLVLIFIPLFETIIYPAFAKCHMLRTPLQKMSVGGLISALAFVASGLLELRLQSSYPVLPGNGIGQFRLYNGLNCSLNVTSIPKNFDMTSSTSGIYGSLDAYDSLYVQGISVKELSELQFSVNATCNPQTPVWTEIIPDLSHTDNVALSYLVAGSPSDMKVKFLNTTDDVTKSRDGFSKIRLIYYGNQDVTLTLTADYQSKLVKEVYHLEKDTINYPCRTLETVGADYSVNIDGGDYGDLLLKNIRLKFGGVYTLIVIQDQESFIVRLFETQPPNSVHIAWQLPQYIIITVAEVMFSITGLEFSYSQAPRSMKSVIQALFLLTTSVGNALVVLIIAKIKMDNQAVEFFTFAVLMVIVMGLFIIIATKYRYVDNEEDEK